MLDAPAWQALAEGLLARRSGAVVVLALPSGRPLALAGACGLPRPPGSALKPLWALALAEAGLGPPTRRWRCQGALLDAQGRRQLCWKPGGHGELGLEAALAQSCNLAALRWGEALGPAAMAEAWGRAGLGEAGARPWPLGGASLPVAFTLGEAPPTWLSPLRLARWGAEWAQGGPAWASAASRGRVRQALAMATAPGGTAHAVSTGPWTVAAKTGTVPFGPRPRTLGWAWGYAPRERPQLAFAVCVPGQGGSHAAPLVGALLRGGARPPRPR